MFPPLHIYEVENRGAIAQGGVRIWICNFKCMLDGKVVFHFLSKFNKATQNKNRNSFMIFEKLFAINQLMTNEGVLIFAPLFLSSVFLTGYGKGVDVYPTSTELVPSLIKWSQQVVKWFHWVVLKWDSCLHTRPTNNEVRIFYLYFCGDWRENPSTCRLLINSSHSWHEKRDSDEKTMF